MGCQVGMAVEVQLVEEFDVWWWGHHRGIDCSQEHVLLAGKKERNVVDVKRIPEFLFFRC